MPAIFTCGYNTGSSYAELKECQVVVVECFLSGWTKFSMRCVSFVLLLWVVLQGEMRVVQESAVKKLIILQGHPIQKCSMSQPVWGGTYLEIRHKSFLTNMSFPRGWRQCGKDATTKYERCEAACLKPLTMFPLWLWVTTDSKHNRWWSSTAVSWSWLSRFLKSWP